MTSREDLKDGEEKIEQFLTHLAVKSGVAKRQDEETKTGINRVCP